MPHTSQTEALSLDAQINEVRREIGMRVSVYDKWVATGRMTQQTADRQIALMRAVAESLARLRAIEAEQAGLRG